VTNPFATVRAAATNLLTGMARTCRNHPTPGTHKPPLPRERKGQRWCRVGIQVKQVAPDHLRQLAQSVSAHSTSCARASNCVSSSRLFYVACQTSGPVAPILQVMPCVLPEHPTSMNSLPAIHGSEKNQHETARRTGAVAQPNSDAPEAPSRLPLGGTAA
jgi:hypothetical protein